MSSPPRVRYEDLLVKLHREMRAGRGEGARAEELRAEMDALWYELTEDEQALFDELSEDLYVVEGKRRIVPLAEGETPALLGQRMSAAFKAHDARLQLSLLRKWPAFDANAVYVMARCWDRLRFFLGAVCFYDHANELEAKDSYEYLAIEALACAGRISEASARCRAIEARPVVSGNLLAKVAVILYRAAPLAEEAERRGLWAHVTSLVERVWDDPMVLASDRAMSLLAAGFSYEKLGDEARALRSFDRAVAAYPFEAPLLARGLALLHVDRPRAMRDFAKAVDLGTKFDWPYLYAVHHAIETGDYAEAERICEAGLSFARPGEVRGRLFEWWAIAAAQLGRSPAEVNALFDRAMTELPLDPVLQSNVRRYQESLAAQPASPRGAWELAQVVDEDEARKSLPLAA
jgi:tetratricopeptide (TPR) repeat protein